MMLMELKCYPLPHCPFKLDDFTDEIDFDNMVLGQALNTDTS